MKAAHGRDETDVRQSVTTALFKNSGLALVCRLIVAASSLCAVPFFIHWLGVGGYGFWETILSLGYIVCLPLNILYGTLFWWMSQAYGKGDHPSVARSAGIGCTATGAYVLLVLPVIWLVRYPLISAINAPVSERAELSHIVFLSVGLLITGGVTEIMMQMIAAAQRMGDALICQTVGRLVLFGASIIGLQAGHGFHGMVAGQAAGLFVQTLLLFSVLRRLYPGARLRPHLPTGEDFRALSRYAGLMGTGAVASILKEQADKLILATCASPTWVGFYSIAARLANLLLDFNRFFYQPFMAAAGVFHARGDDEGLGSLYLKVLSSVAVCTGLMFIMVIGGFDRVLVLWLGTPMPDVSSILFLLVLANSVTVILTGPQTALCRGTGRIQTETNFLLTSLVLNLAGTILLVSLVGPLGTVYATAGSSLLCGILFTWQFHRNIPVPVVGVRHAVYAYSIAMLIAGMVRAVFTFLPAPADRSMALVSLAAGVLPAFLAYMAVLVNTGLVRIADIRALVAKR